MASFGVLYDELHSLRGVFDDAERWRALDEAEWERLDRRISGLEGIINTAAPASIGDCAIKLRVLLGLGRGVNLGDYHEHDTALRQVAEFLEARG